MVMVRVSDAVSAGIGLALGFTMGQHVSCVLRQMPKGTIKQVIVCLSCGNKNSRA
jgi:hypothetical protein